MNYDKMCSVKILVGVLTPQTELKFIRLQRLMRRTDDCGRPPKRVAVG
jgi:hypothetical protein